MTDLDKQLELLLGNDVPPTLRALVGTLTIIAGPDVLRIFEGVSRDEDLRAWNHQPDTSFMNLKDALFAILDGRPEPSDRNAEDFVLAFLARLREHNRSVDNDPTLLGSPLGQQFCRFLEHVHASIGIDRIVATVRSVPELMDKKLIEGGAALLDACLDSKSLPEASMRARLERLSRAAELVWRPLLRVYLKLTCALRGDSIADRDVRMLGQLHHQCTMRWTAPTSPTALLDPVLLAIRTAHAHPHLVGIDPARGLFSAQTTHAIGPYSDADLQAMAQSILLRFFQALLALETVISAEIFRRLDLHGWRILPDQPLFPLPK